MDMVTPMPATRGTTRTSFGWAVALVATLVVAGLIPLAFDPRFYFYGDTQSAYLGWWYHLGEQVRAGSWPVLDPQSWRAGNFVAEQQWGLFSPLTIALGLAATLVSDVVLFATVLKIVFVAVAGVGVFLLARSYGVHPAAAYVAGVAVPLGGQTQYLDLPSWMNGQMVWALLPWAWWAMRRTMTVQANPWPALLASYLIVTVGYVYGTLYLAVVVVGCLAEAWFTRNRAGGVKVILVGLSSALVAIAVYLPGILTSHVTVRDNWEILSDGELQADLPGLMASMLPTVLSPANEALPVHYIAWFLPLLAWVDTSRIRRELRSWSGLIVVLVAMLAWAVGPNQLGPLRWPVRVMPVVVLVTVVLAVVVFTRTVHRPPTLRRLWSSLLLTFGAVYLVVSRFWEMRRMHLLCMVAVMVGLVVVWALFRTRSRDGTPWRPGQAVAAGFIGAWCLGMLVVQHLYFPDVPSDDRNMPALAADYRGQLSDAEGDVMLVGDPEMSAIEDASVADDVLIAASWYLNPNPVQNTYTTISFRPYFDRFCIRYIGSTCPGLLDRLFEREPRTGEQWVDLLSVSTLLIFRDDFVGTTVMDPPAGWRIAEETRWTVTWVRDDPLPTAGGVVWSSPGVEVSAVSSDDRDVSFRVDEVPAGGGEIVLSRLAWPGYQVGGASIGPAIDDQLLTVDVSDTASGDQVDVHFEPPGWTFGLACWLLGVGLAVGWSVLELVRRRRNRRVSESRGRSR